MWKLQSKESVEFVVSVFVMPTDERFFGLKPRKGLQSELIALGIGPRQQSILAQLPPGSMERIVFEETMQSYTGAWLDANCCFFANQLPDWPMRLAICRRLGLNISTYPQLPAAHTLCALCGKTMAPTGEHAWSSCVSRTGFIRCHTMTSRALRGALASATALAVSPSEPKLLAYSVPVAPGYTLATVPRLSADIYVADHARAGAERFIDVSFSAVQQGDKRGDAIRRVETGKAKKYAP